MGASSHKSQPLEVEPGSLRELANIAVPLVLSCGSLSVMHVVDRIFLTWWSTDAVAASLPAGMIQWAAMSIAMGNATYVNTFIAQYEGAGQKQRVSESFWQGIYLALIWGGILLIGIPLAPQIFYWIGHVPEVQSLEVDYFSIVCLGTGPALLSTVLSCFYTGRSKTMVVMWVNLSAVVLNIVLDYCLIFGAGPFPAMGIKGAAIATVTANVSTMVFFILIMYLKHEAREYGLFNHYRWNRELFMRLLRYGFPNGMLYFVDIIGFTIFVVLVGRIGKVELAATTIAFNLNSLAFIPMMGVGTAVMTLVGTRVGESKPQLAVTTTWKAFAVSATYMLLFAAVYVGFPELLLSPYEPEVITADFLEVKETVIVLLRFAALFAFFDAAAVVFSSAIRGAGDTRFCMIYTLISGWAIMVIPTILIWMYADASVKLFGSWIACTSFIAALGIGYLIRFQLGHWKKMRVIEDHFLKPVVEDEEQPFEEVVK
ncbi:MAG: MATE family efflux transporter [Planctomycetes bacterium]|nr:MATE family efflux transporter [Planctomycetota bacterium]MCH9724533.1 MATE family efflux transporter [Planctomycetota bacterium]MCH9776175.1 MATE family efflux transporter [Planctomycetota bacterium]MCH9791374.1 MATE family efflux transporter [Planctomycetota bacterium]